MKKTSEKSELGPKAIRLKQIKEYYKLKNERKFANFLGIPPTTLSSWYKRNMFDANVIFSKCGQINLDWLFTGEGEMLRSNMRLTDEPGTYSKTKTPTKIPLIALDAFPSFEPGAPLEIPDNAWYVIPVFNNADFLVTVTGNSMFPNYEANDILACKKLQTKDLVFQWNKVYLLSTKQEGTMIKRVTEGKNGKQITLVSDNPDHKPFELLLSKIQAIAIVTGILSVE